MDADGSGNIDGGEFGNAFQVGRLIESICCLSLLHHSHSCSTSGFRTAEVSTSFSVDIAAAGNPNEQGGD